MKSIFVMEEEVESVRAERNALLDKIWKGEIFRRDEKIRKLQEAILTHKAAMDHHGGDIDFTLWGALDK